MIGAEVRFARFLCLIFSLLCPGGPSQAATHGGADLDARQLASMARASYNAGRYEEAISHAKRALKFSRSAGEITPTTEREQVRWVPDRFYVYLEGLLSTAYYRLEQLDLALEYALDATEHAAAVYSKASIQFARLAKNASTILSRLGKIDRAGEYATEALRAFEQSGGTTSPAAITAAKNLAALLYASGRHEDVLVNLSEYIERFNEVEAGEIDFSPDYIDLMITVANIKTSQKYIIESEKILQKIGSIIDQIDSLPPRTDARFRLAKSYVASNRFNLNEAERNLNDVIGDLDKNDPLYTEAQMALAFIYDIKGQIPEAYKIYKQIAEEKNNDFSNKFVVGYALLYLTGLEIRLGLHERAGRFLKIAQDIIKSSVGESHQAFAGAVRVRALLYAELGKFEAAAAEAERSLTILRGITGHTRSGLFASNWMLGTVLNQAERFSEAVLAFVRASEIGIEIYGRIENSPPGFLTELGETYTDLGRFAEAEEAIRIAVDKRKSYGAMYPLTLARSLHALFTLRMRQGFISEARNVGREFLKIMLNSIDGGHYKSEVVRKEFAVSRSLFEQFIKLEYENLNRRYISLDEFGSDMFLAAQFPLLTATAAAVARMSSRLAADESALGRLIREYQDASAEWQAIERALTEELATFDKGIGGKKQKDLRARLRQLEVRIGKMDRDISKKFPEYHKLTNPRPVVLQVVMDVLKEDEALWLQLTSEDRTYLFLIRKDKAIMTSTDMTRDELTDLVIRVRSGLDRGKADSLSALMNFDIQAAYELYKKLFEPFRNELRTVKHLILIADGAMQNLPPAVLIDSLPNEHPESFGDFQTLGFLGRKYAFSISPSVSSFVALRQAATRSRAELPFFGVGDPELGGSAAGKRSIPGEIIDRMVTQTDLSALRTLSSLPDTREELTTISEILGGDTESLLLGKQATESRVKSSDLSRYRVVAFATHGLIAGDFRGLAEPALVLSPPSEASDIDDGLLTVSEIAQLELDADWVILSACNTAAPEGRPGAEGLSGLARAFFYAGSRALLVSHWSVESYPTVLLTTGAINALAADPAIGRAEAVRRAMVKLMDGAGPSYYAHPAFWAPFVVVGEGGRPL